MVRRTLWSLVLGSTSLIERVPAFLIFSQIDVMTHVTVVVVSTSSASLPPGFVGGRLGTYTQFSTLSLLLKLFLLISLSS